MKKDQKLTWLGLLSILAISILGGLAYIWATPENGNSSRSELPRAETSGSTQPDSIPADELPPPGSIDEWISGHISSVDRCRYSIELVNEDSRDREIIITTDTGTETRLLRSGKSSFREIRTDGTTWVEVKTVDGKHIAETVPTPTRFDDTYHYYVDRFFPFTAVECQNGTLPGK